MPSIARAQDAQDAADAAQDAADSTDQAAQDTQDAADTAHRQQVHAPVKLRRTRPMLHRTLLIRRLRPRRMPKMPQMLRKKLLIPTNSEVSTR
jgi:hypothetical protein